MGSKKYDPGDYDALHEEARRRERQAREAYDQALGQAQAQSGTTSSGGTTRNEGLTTAADKLRRAKDRRKAMKRLKDRPPDSR